MNETTDLRINRPEQRPDTGQKLNQQAGGPMPSRVVKRIEKPLATGTKPKVPTPAADDIKKTKPVKASVENGHKDYTEYRYLVRILKGSALPILYAVVSIFMLREYVFEFTNYYEYNILVIVLGFVLGLITMSGLTTYNLYRARSKKKQGIDLKSTVILILYIPILIIIVALALIWGLSTMWQFSIGFFVTSLFPPLIVILSEVVAKGKFFIREMESPKKGLKLILTPSGTE